MSDGSFAFDSFFVLPHLIVIISGMKLKLLNTDRKNRKSIDKTAPQRSRRGRNLLVFLAFVLLSAIFWLLQSLQQVYTSTYSIPVVYSELPPEIGATGKLPDRLDVVLKDKGMNLLAYSIDGFSPVTVTATEQEIRRKKDMSMRKKELTELIQKQLLSTTTILSISPEEIQATFYPRKKKTVPIILNGKVTPKNGFYAFDPELSPEVVTVYGSEEVLSGITSVETEAFSLDRLDSDFSGEMAINPIEEVLIRPTSVKMKIRVEQLTEQTFELPIITKNVPEGYLLRPLPGKVSIQLTMPTSHYKEISEADLQVAVFHPSTPDSLKSDISLPVQLIMKPEWLKLYKISPAHVQFIIERVQLNQP